MSLAFSIQIEDNTKYEDARRALHDSLQEQAAYRHADKLRSCPTACDLCCMQMSCAQQDQTAACI